MSPAFPARDCRTEMVLPADDEPHPERSESDVGNAAPASTAAGLFRGERANRKESPVGQPGAAEIRLKYRRHAACQASPLCACPEAAKTAEQKKRKLSLAVP